MFDFFYTEKQFLNRQIGQLLYICDTLCVNLLADIGLLEVLETHHMKPFQR